MQMDLFCLLPMSFLLICLLIYSIRRRRLAHQVADLDYMTKCIRLIGHLKLLIPVL